jgi:hypothetical protein
VEWSTRRLHIATLAQEGQELQLGAMEVSGDVDGLAADHNDALAQQQLLGHHGGETAQQVVLAVDDDWLGLESHCFQFLYSLFSSGLKFKKCMNVWCECV